MAEGVVEACRSLPRRTQVKGRLGKGMETMSERKSGVGERKSEETGVDNSLRFLLTFLRLENGRAEAVACFFGR